MEHWWNDTVRVKYKYAERKHSVYQIPHELIWDRTRAPAVRPASSPRTVGPFPCSQLNSGILYFNKHILQGASFLRNEDFRFWAAYRDEGVLQTVLPAETVCVSRL